MNSTSENDGARLDPMTDANTNSANILPMTEAFFTDTELKMLKPEIAPLINLLQSQLSFLSEQFSIKRIGVFGSVAKNQAHVDSDIDLVVEFEQPLGFKFIELAEYLEKLLDHKVDLLTLEGIKSISQESVKKSILESIIYV